MKGFIKLYRYTNEYYREREVSPILINVSKINTVYRIKHHTSSLSYDYITTIFIDNTEYHVKEDYYTVVDMIEEALRSDELVDEVEDDKEE